MRGVFGCLEVDMAQDIVKVPSSKVLDSRLHIHFWDLFPFLPNVLIVNPLFISHSSYL